MCARVRMRKRGRLSLYLKIAPFFLLKVVVSSERHPVHDSPRTRRLVCVVRCDGVQRGVVVPA